MGNRSSSVHEEKKQEEKSNHQRLAVKTNVGGGVARSNNGDESRDEATVEVLELLSLATAPDDRCAEQLQADDASDDENVDLRRPSDSEREPFQETPERKSPQTTAERRLELKVALHSHATKEVNVYTLQFVPSNVLALKEYVQNTYHVPRHCQSVTFDGVSLLDTDTLPLHYMRSGDVIEIHFQSEADTEFISGVLDSLSRVVAYLESMEPGLCQATAVHTHISIQQMQDFQDMSLQYFQCTLEERSCSNFLFFCANGGHNLVSRLHKQILSHPWKCLPDMLKYLENESLMLCWAITELGSRFNALVCCHPIQSVLVQIASGNRPKHCSMCTSSLPNTAFSSLDDQQIFKDTTRKASSALTNLVELFPSFRVEIVRNEAAMAGLIQQLVPSGDSLPVDHEITLGLLTAFLCMAYSPETHQYLVTREIIDAVMIAPTKQNEENRNFCRYISCLFLAMICTTPTARQEISAEHMKRIGIFMAEFLDSNNSTDLQTFEEEHGIYWVTMLPHMRVVYTPVTQCNVGKPSLDTKVLFLCLKTAIFSLHVMNLNSESKHVLAKEGLLDYLQCLPWCLPPQSEVQQCALQLTRDLVGMLPQPPSLANMARAKLAAMHFGLDSVLCKHIHELGSELYSTFQL